MNDVRPAPSRYSMGSMPNMLRSLLVILAMVLVVLAIVPRSQGIDRPAVDAVDKAAHTVKDTGLAVTLPQGLPQGWKSTAVSYEPSTDAVPTFTAVYQDPAGEFVAIKQASRPTQGWFDKAIDQGTAQSEVAIGSATWKHFWNGEKSRRSLARAVDGLTTVVIGSGSVEHLMEFTERLAPVPPAS